MFGSFSSPTDTESTDSSVKKHIHAVRTVLVNITKKKDFVLIIPIVANKVCENETRFKTKYVDSYFSILLHILCKYLYFYL